MKKKTMYTLLLLFAVLVLGIGITTQLFLPAALSSYGS